MIIYRIEKAGIIRHVVQDFPMWTQILDLYAVEGYTVTRVNAQ
jgi:hypothetical protein